MPIDTTEVNTNNRIADAIKTIGRSEDRRKVFEEIYRGRSNGKSAKEISLNIGIKEKRVLEEALPLSRANIVGKQKVNGRFVYTKNEFFSLHRATMLRLIDNEVARKKFLNTVKPIANIALMPVQTRRPQKSSTKRAKIIKILFLSANPEKTKRLRLDEEAREIENRIALAQKRDQFLLIKKGAVMTDDLQRYLNEEKPVIVHFSGHGSEEKRIILEDNLGNPEEVSISALQSVFETLKDNIRCVILNACFSLGQAKAINNNIDFVIGLSDSISDKAAITFSYAFYLALASGRSIQNAFEQGKIR
jgi:hypothetical protein